jgi:hypothetical protein
MKQLKVIHLLLGFILLTSCQTDSEWQNLYNQTDLDGWETYIGAQAKGESPIGLNNDYLKLFTIVDEDNAKLIRISGEVNAALTYKEEVFENYHLQAEFKYGDEKTKTFNSGILYHSYGEYGKGLGVWMNSHELQLMTGQVGGSYRMGNTYCEIPTQINEKNKATYAVDGEMNVFAPKAQYGKYCSMSPDAENAFGEWNVVDLYCLGQTSVHVVNGTVVCVNNNSQKVLADGSKEPLSKGKIQIQSEGGELFLKSVRVKPLERFPEQFASYLE